MSAKKPRATESSQPTYVRLPRELHVAVKERAVADERTMAQTIRLALRHYLKSTQPLA
jgi:type II secretory pathway component PulC